MIKNIYDLIPSEEIIHGGIGLCKSVTVFDEEELQTPTKFINYTVLPVGATFGLHEHANDNEFYFVVGGEGEYTSNGVTTVVHTGDIMVNEPYAMHALKNTGTTELKMLVFEVYNFEN